MRDKGKKQVKFYSDLSAEEKADIIYLPDASKSVSSQREKKDIESNAAIAQDKRAASSDSSFRATKRDSHSFSSARSIPFPYSPISGKDNLSQKKENRALRGFRDPSFSGSGEVSYRDKTLRDSLSHNSNPSTSSKQADNGKPYYYELSEKEKKNVLYLHDFPKKKTKKQFSYQRAFQNKGVVIPFPAPKTSSKPAAAAGRDFLLGFRAKNVMAFAFLLAISGALTTAMKDVIGDRSKKFVIDKIKKEHNLQELMLTRKLTLVPKTLAPETRDIANQDTLIPKWIAKQTSSEPSHIIQYMKKKEIKIIKAVSPSHSMNNP